MTHLDPELCYLAMQSSDPRFDGQFFAAVRTTRIYCRSICPARLPLRRNVSFYPSAAAAEQAGFRPCRRCRPDAAPGSPEWNGKSAVVSRGLRMICEGALDDGGVDELSARLGVGQRHLSRLFMEHVGAPPVAVAQTRRVHFARSLIEHTDLPMTEIAAGSGFGSLRRFNAAFKRAFDMPPSAMRRSVGDEHAPPGLGVDLSYRPPLDWPALLVFLAPRATPGIERVEGRGYVRTVTDGKHAGTLQVEPGRQPNTLRLTTSLPPSRSLLRIVERVRLLFDLRADPRRIAGHLGGDPVLGPSVEENPGLRVPGAWDGFELAVRAVLGQQVSVKGATTLAGRLVARYGRALDATAAAPGLTHLFPDAATLARVDIGRLGMPGSRAEAIRALARAVDSGRVDLNPSADPELARRRLRELPGIGPWTADYVAMRALGQPDAFPEGDLGLRKAASSNGRPLSGPQLRHIAEPWRPWRAYAAMHLWKGAGPGNTTKPKERRP